MGKGGKAVAVNGSKRGNKAQKLTAHSAVFGEGGGIAAGGQNIGGKRGRIIRAEGAGNAQHLPNGGQCAYKIFGFRRFAHAEEKLPLQLLKPGFFLCGNRQSNDAQLLRKICIVYMNSALFQLVGHVYGNKHRKVQLTKLKS